MAVSQSVQAVLAWAVTAVAVEAVVMSVIEPLPPAAFPDEACQNQMWCAPDFACSCRYAEKFFVR